MTVDSGVTATLASGSSFAAVNVFGTLDVLGSLASGTAVNLEGNGANSVFDFSGSSSATALTNLGTSDVIILGTSALAEPSGVAGIAFAYNGSLVTVIETNASGATLASDVITVTGTAGTILTAGSLVGYTTSNGVNIELASSLLYTFTGASSTTFETNANWAGNVAPGDSLVAPEWVTIAGGSASVFSASLVDNGTIVVGTTFTDAGTITGTGTLNVGTGAQATLTGNTSLGSIIDSGPWF